MFGNPEVTTGGKALKFYASVRLDVRKGEPVKNGTEIIGNHTKVKVVKNKVAPPFRTAEFDIIYGKGISRASTVLDLAVQYGIIEKSGAWFTYNDERLGDRGKDSVKSLLESNEELCNEIEQKIREAAASINEFADNDGVDETESDE